MIIFKEAQKLTDYLQVQRQKARSIAFVPTMGALHDGHLSLVQQAASEASLVVCSIFVNPTQFNNPDDFKQYPKTIEKDIDLLEGSGASILFLPEVEEIYPAGSELKHFDLGRIENVLEGAHRPGHFQGVCNVVDRLLSIVTPDLLFLGQKDLQQCIVIYHLLQLTGRTEHMQLRIVPTKREKDGLAMSSRNLRLTESQRALAPQLYHALSELRWAYGNDDPHKLLPTLRKRLEEEGFEVDYLELAEGSDLSLLNYPGKEPVALVAASIGSVRLIDNLPLS